MTTAPSVTSGIVVVVLAGSVVVVGGEVVVEDGGVLGADCAAAGGDPGGAACGVVTPVAGRDVGVAFSGPKVHPPSMMDTSAQAVATRRDLLNCVVIRGVIRRLASRASVHPAESCLG
jgi:hypothetical protein